MSKSVSGGKPTYEERLRVANEVMGSDYIEEQGLDEGLSADDRRWLDVVVLRDRHIAELEKKLLQTEAPRNQ